jgi:prolipoprotein diacylglyceryltransferase
MIAAFFGFIVLCLILLAFAFWIWMIIDCATKEPNEGNDKLVWIVIIVFTQIIGALIYYFVRRPQRIAQLGQ